MTRSVRTAAVFMAVVAVANPVYPAMAKGFNFTVTPRGESAHAIRTGLTIYGIARDLRNRARTSQRGSDNGAAISQHGRGNSAVVVQRGRANSGTISQNGNDNYYGLFQFGRRNSSNIVQTGNGKLGLAVQGGW